MWAQSHASSHLGLYPDKSIKGRLMDVSGVSDGKEFAWNAGDLRSVPGLGRSPGKGNGNHSSILAWRIPWTEKPDRL